MNIFGFLTLNIEILTVLLDASYVSFHFRSSGIEYKIMLYVTSIAMVVMLVE